MRVPASRTPCAAAARAHRVARARAARPARAAAVSGAGRHRRSVTAAPCASRVAPAPHAYPAPVDRCRRSLHRANRVPCAWDAGRPRRPRATGERLDGGNSPRRAPPLCCAANQLALLSHGERDDAPEPSAAPDARASAHASRPPWVATQEPIERGWARRHQLQPDALRDCFQAQVAHVGAALFIRANPLAFENQYRLHLQNTGLLGKQSRSRGLHA